MFKLSRAAARQVQHAANVSGALEMALRIAARIDDGGSIRYGMGFDNPNDGDMKLDLDGVAVVIAESSQELLDDTTLDYVELEPGSFNFIFIDGRQPQGAADGCGAGGCHTGGCAKSGGTQ